MMRNTLNPGRFPLIPARDSSCRPGYFGSGGVPDGSGGAGWYGGSYRGKPLRTAAFTLIELMVVVLIIAALAGMVLPHLLPASDSAKRKIAAGDIANISVALKLYRLHNGRYPTTEEGLDVLLKVPASGDWNEPYLERAPIDPWGRRYEYRCPGAQASVGFDLWSEGPDPQKSNDNVNNWDAPSR